MADLDYDKALDIVCDALSGLMTPLDPEKDEGTEIDDALRDLAEVNPDGLEAMYDYMKSRLSKIGYYIGFLPDTLAKPEFKTVGQLAKIMERTAIEK